MPHISAPLILFAAGDPGGANALVPVARLLAARGAAVALLDHGHLGRNAPTGLPRLAPPPEGADLAAWLAGQRIGPLCFATSLTDRLPLALARAGQAAGHPVVCVLDNWVNYRVRLSMDGAGDLIPDCYAVMDGKAHEEALAEGVPDSCLRVTGHPALAALADEIAAAGPDWRRDLRRRLGLGLNGRALLAFIGEPVAHDQGTGPHSPVWRGYTEDEVLPLLCRELQAGADGLDLVIVPHPRDDLTRLDALWQRSRGRLAGGLAPAGLGGRQIVLASDRVAGMASIMLYESWLQGKPTLSLQPGLVRPDLISLASRPGMVFVDRPEAAAEGIERWMRIEPLGPRPDLDHHRQAPAVLADLLQQMTGHAHGTD